MKIFFLRLVSTAVCLSIVTGCASYRTSSNIPEGQLQTIPSAKTVLITEDALPNRKYKVIGPIEVSVKKLTMFHKDPTKEQADIALSEKAKQIGADAVIDVKYKTGIGFTTWGYIDASGKGVLLAD